MRLLLFVLLAMQLASCTTVERNCSWNAALVSPSSARLPPAAFAAISIDMTVLEIVRHLGPAKGEGGFGLHVLMWEVTDGRTFYVSTAGACSKPVASRFL